MRGKRRRKPHPHPQLYVTGSSAHIAIPKTPSKAGAKFFPFTKNGTPCTRTKVGKARLGKACVKLKFASGCQWQHNTCAESTWRAKTTKCENSNPNLVCATAVNIKRQWSVYSVDVLSTRSAYFFLLSRFFSCAISWIISYYIIHGYISLATMLVYM